MKYLRGVLLGVAGCAPFIVAVQLLRPPLLVADALLVFPAVVLWAWVLYCRRARRRAPERYRAYAARHFDATAGPPPGAEPVEEPVVTRWFAADDGDWRAAADLLAPGFRYLAPGRRIRRARFVQVMRNGGGVLRHETLGLTVLSDPEATDVVWVREESVDGGDFRTAVWHRWTLTPDRRQIRQLELVAFVAPLVPA